MCVLGGNHRTDWVTTYAFDLIHKNIFNNVWIVNNVLIMSGVTISDGIVIATLLINRVV